MDRRSKTILLSGSIAFIATIVISILCIDDWSGLTGWAFGTMLWSEVVFISGLIFVEWVSEETEQIITKSALYAFISAYAVINILTSILYIACFKEAVTSFVVIQVALFAITAILIIVSLTTGKSVYKANEQTMKAAANMEAMVERLNKLAANPECERFSSTLKKLSEDLRYTDISVSVPEDAEISDVLSKVEIEIGNSNEKIAEDIKAAVVRLNSLIAQRKVSVGANKRGRI